MASGTFPIPQVHQYIEVVHWGYRMKRFAELTEQEVLALAITNEEEDSRIYLSFAEGLRERFPSSAKVFEEMAAEEVRHRGMLYDLYRKAAEGARDASIRELLVNLAEAEDTHENLAETLSDRILTDTIKDPVGPEFMAPPDRVAA